MFCVFVAFKLKPGKLEAFRAIALDLMEQTRREAGCLSYEIGEARDGYIAWVERWASEEALAAHKATAHYVQGEEKMEGLFEGAPQVWRVEPFA